MTPFATSLLFATLDTGWQHAVFCTPDGLYFLFVAGPVRVH
jgi:hypothetical protein